MKITKQDIKIAVIEFYNREYGDMETTPNDLNDISIPLASTDTEDEKYTLSVVLNLEELCIINFINNHIHSIDLYKNLNDVYYIIKNMSFDGLVNFIDFDEIEDFLLDLEESQV